MKTNTNADLKARMSVALSRACRALGIAPTDTSVGVRSFACFATSHEADILRDALALAGEASIDVHHSPVAMNPDLDADEWQVSWGPL